MISEITETGMGAGLRLGEKRVLFLDDLTFGPAEIGTVIRPVALLRFAEREGRRHWVVVNVQYTPSA